MITQITNHIVSCPALAPWHIQSGTRAAGLGEGGVFFQGSQELSRTRDLLGGGFVRHRLTLLLELAGSGDLSGRLQDTALWLTRNKGPVLGLEQTVAPQGVKGPKTGPDGISLWELRLDYEFTTKEGGT